jgi:hypothetical protein
MHSLFVASLGLLTACGLVPTVGAPFDEGGADSATLIGPIDVDGDGSPEGEDCNDDDGTMTPGAVEICDGKDNDCNGEVDDTADAVLYYRDADADGWGSETDTLLSCTVPDGYLPTAGDCNDADPAVHPETDDWCDGVDTDCDGTTDEDEVIWYPDADKDGYGGEGGEVSCKPLEGHLLTSGDCDDADPLVHPGVLDDDCDGQDDDCDQQTDDDSALLSWHYDLDGDTYGAASFSIESCDQPYPTMITDGSDCNDNDPAIHPGAKEICGDKVDQDCDASDDEC